MEKLISRRINIQCVPDSYVLPPEIRPGKQSIPVFKNVPIIDFGCGSRQEMVGKIQEACKKNGVFQVINHGVPENLMQRMMMVAKDFFERPVLEDMASCYTDDPKDSSRLYTSVHYEREKFHYWRDSLRLLCHPLEDYIQSWPLNQPQSRDVAEKYVKELRKLSMRILDIIGEGLGFEAGYFESTNLTKNHIMALSHYPGCPDPSVTLGLPAHIDFNVISLVHQEEDLTGLQFLINDEWVVIEPIPNAFVVTIGGTLQVLSNGKLKSDSHRVVTNIVPRTSIISGIHPCNDTYIEPAKSMVNGQNHARYKGFIYRDLFASYIEDVTSGKSILERYELNPS